MDWLLANPQIHSTFASLGSMQNDQYIVSENCLAVLEEINCKLVTEDLTLRTFRRAIGYGQNVKNDLIPLLLNAKCPKIIISCIRTLVNLTVPVECLVNVDVMLRTETGRHTMYEINKLLVSCKEQFTDVRTTKSIIDFMKHILEKEVKTSLENCNSINACLLLLRNILHIPEMITYKPTLQNQLVWNLFTQSIDKMLLHLMTCTQKSYWGITIVQLIALMYKDQPVNTLSKLLNIWFEGAISDSSDDNESNTTPPKQCSGDSSPMLTSDPTSDSSDNGGKGGSNDDSISGSCSNSISEQSESKHINRMSEDTFQSPLIWAKSSKQKSNDNHRGESISSNHSSINSRDHNINKSMQLKTRDLPSPPSELSDCGYGTQVENQESISTSSNDDENPQSKPIHHPPSKQKQRYNPARSSNLTTQDKKEWRRKKLVKRSRNNLLNMKSLVHHTPTDEDITTILKEFTVDFLLKGYGNLVRGLHAQLLTELQVQVDTSHFFWLITYFLKFAAQLELELDHISFVITFDVLSYLTYEGVSLCEEIELASKHQGSELKSCLRRMHLLVTAIREFLQAIDTYKRINHLSIEDKKYLKILQCQIASTNDLKCLFILLLQRYNPILQNKQFLQDLIITNHILLVLLDDASKFPEYHSKIKMIEHISNFATVEIMYNYGLLLENFRVNGEFVNDCIFTMMHHIGGDLGQSSSLFQPIILKTYSQIWETEYELCDDWSDLIEYVIHKFINTPQPAPILPPRTLKNDNISLTQRDVGNLQINWTQETMDNLYWFYVQSKKSPDVVGKIIQKFQDNGNNIKARLAVIQQLLQQDIINFVEYDELMRYEDGNTVRSIKTTTKIDPDSGIEIREKPIDDVQLLCDRLLEENKGEHLLWVQQILVECCFVKLNIKCEIANCTKHVKLLQEIRVLEPVPHHCIMKKQSIPVVPRNAEQTNILNYQPFALLLHKLGFHLPADAGKLFVRIPDFWTADTLYNIALKLGPLDKSKLKFDESQIIMNRTQSSERFQPLSIDGNNASHIHPIEPIRSFSDYFTIPRTKKSNSMTRFTPNPIISMPTVPNWPHIIMKSKNIADQSIPHLLASATTITTNLTTSTPIVSTEIFETLTINIVDTEIFVPCTTTTTPLRPSTAVPQININNNSINHTKNSLFNSLIKPVTVSEQIIMSSLYKHQTNNLSLLKIADDINVFETADTELVGSGNGNNYEKTVQENIEALSNCETASVASDLTRMYVSDEEDKSINGDVQIKSI